MARSTPYLPAFFALAACLSVAGVSQGAPASTAAGPSQQTGSSGAPDSLPPLSDPATVDQIREYLRLSGDMDSLRLRWIAAVDKNRIHGAPYWPDSFYTAVKDEMRNTDLLPMYITLFQHDVSRDLMQEVLETYRRLGVDHFQGSPACFKLGDPKLGLTADMDKLKLAKTQEVFNKVYDVYKPQIKATRLKYQADHPGWVDK